MLAVDTLALHTISAKEELVRDALVLVTTRTVLHDIVTGAHNAILFHIAVFLAMSQFTASDAL